MKLKKLLAALTSLACCSGMLSLMPATVSYAAEVVHNNFEVTYEGWHGTDELVTVEAVEGAGYAGSRGMLVTDRKTSEDGAASSKGLYLVGGVNYSYSIYVNAETDEVFHLTLTCDDLETDESTTVELASQAVAAGEWAALEADFKAPANSCEFRLTVTTDTTNDFTIDDLSITTRESKKADAVYAAVAGKGLKDEFANYGFRVGNILNGGTVKNSAILAIMLKDHNAIECENETKPDATLVANGSSNTNINVSLNSCAAIADFCEKNNIGFRGHTMVWHSQTPEWFFKDNFQSSGNWVNSSTMNQRLESFIKNMFAAYERQYPSLDLYSYDVCNECVSDDSNRTKNNGGARMPGYGNGASPWVQVYGDNSFIEKAFTYARTYAPANCKLYYNDYNEYWDHKRDCIINTILKPLSAKGVLDGMGMQSHINADANGFSGLSAYLGAMDMFLALGIDVQVTELDISTEGGKFSLQDQANKYKAIFEHAMDVNTSGKYQGKVTLVQVWGPNDSNSWVGTDRDSGRPNSPLLYDGSNQPKIAYTSITELVPDDQWGDGSQVGGEVKPPEPDANGYWFHDTFEGSTNSWSGRGGASVETSGRTCYEGKEALLCSGRTAEWNGATKSLSARIFKAGEEYSFSVNVCYMDGDADTNSFKLQLQYEDASGETQYVNIDKGVAAKGEWIQLANTNYKIPADATNIQFYVETEDSTNNFYVDDAIGAVAGTVIPGAGKGSARTVIKGDVNGDGIIDVFDLAAAKRGMLKGFANKFDEKCADIDENGTVEIADLIQLQKWMLGIIKEFQVVEKPTEPPTEASTYIYDPAIAFREAPGNYLNPCSQQGKVVTETYNGINGSNTLKVYLPYGYTDSKKYNIFYLMHGGGENENTIFSNDVKLNNILDNMIMNGELEPLIVVTPTFNKCEARTFYNEFRQSVIPFVEGKYSTYAKSTSAADIAASRMHRAYGGFSMGSASTWAVLVNCLDIVAYYMPLSGDNWEADGGYNKAKSVADAVDKFGLKSNEYFIFCATGSEDIAYPNMNPQMDEMKKMTSHFSYGSDFSKNNFYYLVADGKTHWWGYVRHYIYDALPSFFHEGQNT